MREDGTHQIKANPISLKIKNYECHVCLLICDHCSQTGMKIAASHSAPPHKPFETLFLIAKFYLGSAGRENCAPGGQKVVLVGNCKIYIKKLYHFCKFMDRSLCTCCHVAICSRGYNTPMTKKLHVFWKLPSLQTRYSFAHVAVLFQTLGFFSVIGNSPISLLWQGNLI